MCPTDTIIIVADAASRILKIIEEGVRDWNTTFGPKAFIVGHSLWLLEEDTLLGKSYASSNKMEIEQKWVVI